MQINDGLGKTKPDSALALFSALLKQSIWANYDAGIIASLLNIGNIHYYNNEYKKAYETFLKAIQYCKKAPKHARLYTAYAYNHAAITAAQLGQLDQASGLCNKGIEFIEQGNESKTRIETLYTNLGGIYFSARNHEKAIEYFDRAEAIARKRNNIEGLWYCAFNKGLIYLNIAEKKAMLKDCLWRKATSTRH